MIISKKQLIGVVAIGILLAGVVFFIWWVSKGRFIQTTDDAYIGGNITTVASKVSGYISAIEVRDNQSVKKGDIIVADKNFGCGSSREHAAWAVYDYVFRAVVSSFFADIFKGNCLNIGVLPVQVSPEFADTIFKAIEANPKTELEINLPEQTITLLSTGQKESFDINGYKKNNMINGFDDIDYLINIKEEIVDFASKQLI